MADRALEQLKQAVYAANMALVRAGLVVLTWGNASGVDRERGIVAIKPSGVAYDALRPEDIVLVSLENGRAAARRATAALVGHADARLSLPALCEIGGIAHTHSRYATSWAQAVPRDSLLRHHPRRHLPRRRAACRPLTPEEIEEAYEWNTGVVIVEHFRATDLDPLHVPGRLLPFHAPFAWGETPGKGGRERDRPRRGGAPGVAYRAAEPPGATTPQSIVDKHFLRKHGKDAYYGQPKKLIPETYSLTLEPTYDGRRRRRRR